MNVFKIVRLMIVSSLCTVAGMTVAQNQTSLEILQGSAPKAEYLMREAREYFAPLPSADDVIRSAGITGAQIELGKALFFDPRMSSGGDVSCASCHGLDSGGVDNLQFSVGHNGAISERNAPTVLNAVFNVDQFWDGRASDLAEQAKGPVVAVVEMANTPENLIATLNSMPGYKTMFKAAFPSDTNPISFDNFAQAIEAFETTLITPSRFDAFLHGDENALTIAEQIGLSYFMDLGCSACHNGVNIGGGEHQFFGAVEQPSEIVMPRHDKGLGACTAGSEKDYMFRVAPLRNINLTAPYFHSGAVDELEEAVQLMALYQLGTRVDDEVAEMIVSFLNTLEGEVPSVDFPDLPKLPVATIIQEQAYD